MNQFFYSIIKRKRMKATTTLEYLFTGISMGFLLCIFLSMNANASNEHISNCFEQNTQKTTLSGGIGDINKHVKENHKTVFIIMIYNIFFNLHCSMCLHSLSIIIRLAFRWLLWLPFNMDLTCPFDRFDDTIFYAATKTPFRIDWMYAALRIDIYVSSAKECFVTQYIRCTHYTQR